MIKHLHQTLEVCLLHHILTLQRRFDFEPYLCPSFITAIIAPCCVDEEDVIAGADRCCDQEQRTGLDSGHPWTPGNPIQEPNPLSPASSAVST